MCDSKAVRDCCWAFDILSLQKMGIIPTGLYGQTQHLLLFISSWEAKQESQ